MSIFLLKNHSVRESLKNLLKSFQIFAAIFPLQPTTTMMHRARTENYLCDSSSFYVMLATAARLLLLLQQPVFGGDNPDDQTADNKNKAGSSIF